MNAPLTLTEIWIHPIKSLGGIKVPEARVLPKGLELDRRWMLIDANNVFMTQRLNPKLALFKTMLGTGNIGISYVKSLEDQVQIPTDQLPAGDMIQANVWDDTVEVIEVDKSISKWFSAHLDTDCKLVVFPEDHKRPVDEKYAINHDHVSLADAYPFLVIGQSSLDDLNSRLKDPISMDRFRPNFVFRGGEAYEEDGWKNFSIGQNRFVGVKNCARCVMTTVDQETAFKGVEPLATLAQYRKRDNKIYFGQNVIALDYNIVKVGDAITMN